PGIAVLVMRIFQAISIQTATEYWLFGPALIGRSVVGNLSPGFRERAAGLVGPVQRPAGSLSSFLNQRAASSFLNQTAAEPRPPGVAVAVLLLVLLGAPITALGQQNPSSAGEVLTLEQAVALALKENHIVKNRELGVRKAGDALAAARTFRLPSINLYAIASDQLIKNDINIANPVPNIFPGVEPFFSISVPRRFTISFAGLVLEPLSQQYRIGLNIQQARLAQDVEAEALRLAKQDIVDKVKQDYYGILQSQSALESIQEAIKFYRELDRVTGDYVARQVSLRADSLEVKTRLAKAEYEALNLSNQLATQKEQLNNLLGRDIRTEYRVSAVTDVGNSG